MSQPLHNMFKAVDIVLPSDEKRADAGKRSDDMPVPTSDARGQDTKSVMSDSGNSTLHAKGEHPPQANGMEQPQTNGDIPEPSKTERPALPRFTTSKENVLAQFFIGSIDQASHQHGFKQHYPQSVWHEHDPQELIASVEVCVKKATASFEEMGYDIKDIRAIRITNQRETVSVWDYDTGEPLHNTIAWPDTRTMGLVRELKQREKDAGLNLVELTGLPLSTYPSSVKLIWLLQHAPKAKEAYDAGRLAFGTADTWLLYNLNGKNKDYFVTDSNNASRTMSMNLHTVKYDDKLLDFLRLDPTKLYLPRIVPSSDPIVYGAMASGPLQGMKIAGCLGDQSTALVGQQGFTLGSAKNTYGTGCFLLYNVGEKPVISTHGLLATIVYDFRRYRKLVYALEGSIAVAGSGVKYKACILVHKISELAATVDNGGCVFATAFSALLAPYWIDDAKGTIFGITQHTQRGHIARATLEAVCFETKAILDAMEMDSGHALTKLAVDGGMSNLNLCMQTQANITGISINRPAMRETTALGAANAAGFAVNVWKEFDELKAINQKDRTIFTPEASPDDSHKIFKKWTRAVQMCKGWLDADEAGGDYDE